MRTVAFILAILLAPAVAAARGVPHPGVLDPRIQTIPYDPDQVTVLRGSLGYQFMLEFAHEEHIETVSIGDSLGWQVTPNRKADVLFIKPIDRTPGTNLTVLTNERRYVFELTVAPRNAREPVLFVARMTYPPPVLVAAVAAEPVPDPAPVAANTAYSVTGAEANRPARVFDDGRHTYFEWNRDRAVPAIFAVSADGAEGLVNSAIRGPFTMVEQLAPRFILRNGAEVTTVTNDMLAAPKGRRR